jgi:6-phosphogluconolactonase
LSALAMERIEFKTPEALAKGFAKWTADRLRKAVADRGAALLVVSGGSTPALYFDALSQTDVDWPRVSITLADERRVPDDDLRSNARLVRERLLQNEAKEAHFVPLANVRLSRDHELASAQARVAMLPSPADVVVLGMGDDGHTASWFPKADRLAEAIDLATRDLVLPIAAPGLPESRLTLTARVLLRARAIALHIEGAGKRATLEKALGAGPVEEMPVRAVLRGAADRLTIVATG